METMRKDRFTGKNRIREYSYIASDIGTAGFATLQGVSLLTTVPKIVAAIASPFGLVGGFLNVVQGGCLLYEGYVSLIINGQKVQGVCRLWEGFMLVGIGLLMFLASLSVFGVKVGCMATIVANPYAMAALLLGLVIMGLGQTVLLTVQDRGAKLQDPIQQKQLLQRLEKMDGGQISDLMEDISEDVGVEAAIETLDLFRLILEKGKKKAIEEQRVRTENAIASWRRIVRLRAVQLSLYALMFPLGLASALVARAASQVVAVASKFFLAAPSSIGAYLDICEPFKRNGAISVPKV